MKGVRDREVSAGLIHPLWVPARRDPDHRSEMVTQWLCGERVVVVEKKRAWARCRGEDSYEAWTPMSGLLLPGGADEWAGSAAWSLGTPISWSHGGRGYLPWGGRVRVARDRLRLPGGGEVIPETQDTIVGAEQLARRFPADPRAVVQTAGRWLGVPYLWGGRTNTGSDCSGFVQSILRVHGVLLPRDSKDQGAGGEALGDSAHALDDVRPGDLLFFAPEGRGISHVAISTGGTGIIHCSAGRGEVAEDDLSAEPSSDELQRLLRKSLVCTTMPLTGAGQAG